MASPHDDIVAVGGDLEPETLIAAYRRGIFPWPVEGLPLLWFHPVERAILDFQELHVPRSLRRARRRAPFRVTIDADFPAVIRGCADTPRPGQSGTWITAEIVAAYTRLHERGVVHTAEAWEGEALVGGIYGVAVDGVFAAESMFFRRSAASKLALLHLIDHLAARGLDWIDVQVLTPYAARLGARTVTRREFVTRLLSTQARGLRLF